jgi:hypothetical protein
MRDQIIGALIALCIVSLGGLPSPAHAQPTIAYQCVPYDEAVANLESHGWTILPDIPIGPGYSVDRLLIAKDESGFVGAVPVDREQGCAFVVPAIPLGVEDDTPDPRLPPANTTPA